MAKIIAVEYLTLDGVMEDPHLWPYRSGTNEVSEYQEALMLTCDALLLGRVTYEAFAATWPTMPNAGAFGERINAMPKYVATTTLPGGQLPWNGTRIEGEAVEGVAALKRQPGRDLLIYGSAALVRTLLRHRLIDDYRLMFYPLVLGYGKRLFEDTGEARTLKLVETRAFNSGIVVLTYQPVPEA
jgi:dihydrofolate reductase